MTCVSFIQLRQLLLVELIIHNVEMQSDSCDAVVNVAKVAIVTKRAPTGWTTCVINWSRISHYHMALFQQYVPTAEITVKCIWQVDRILFSANIQISLAAGFSLVVGITWCSILLPGQVQGPYSREDESKWTQEPKVNKIDDLGVQ